MALPQGTMGQLYCEVSSKDLAECERVMRVQAERMGADVISVHEDDGEGRPWVKPNSTKSTFMAADYDASGFPDRGEWLVDPSGQRYYVTSQAYFNGKVNPGILSTNGVHVVREVRDGLVAPGDEGETVNSLSRKLAAGWRVEA